MDSIAIVGYSFKLPGGSEDDANFWDMLANARNVMTPWPKTRVNVDAFYDAKSKRTNTVSCSTIIIRT
jgi:acyl transferase domain-containing protein